MAEFSGEQKLRIVLESILRNVPKGEQCQKYGITEAEFDKWNHKLITDGGKIYDEYKPASSVYRTPFMVNLRGLAKIGIILSILINLGGICAFGVWFFSAEEEQFVQDDTVNREIVEDVPPNLQIMKIHFLVARANPQIMKPNTRVTIWKVLFLDLTRQWKIQVRVWKVCLQTL